MEKYVFMIFAALIIFISVIIIVYLVWRNRFARLSGINRILTPIVQPSSSSSTPSNPTVPVIDLSNKTDCRDDSCSVGSCEKSQRLDESEDCYSEERNDLGDRNESGDSSVTVSYPEETQTNSLEGFFGHSPLKGLESRTRSEISMDKNLRILDFQGNCRLINLRDLEYSEINAMESTDENLYLHIIGKGIYVVDKKGKLSCFVATGNNHEKSNYRLKDLDLTKDNTIKSFSLSNNTIYIFTNSVSYELTRKGFKKISGIPKCLYVNIHQNESITYYSTGKIGFGENILKDRMTESINWKAGIKCYDNTIYYLTTSGNFMRSEIHEGELLKGQNISKSVKAFNVNSVGDYCYLTQNGNLLINNRGKESILEVIEETSDKILLSISDRGVYVAGCN